MKGVIIKGMEMPERCFYCPCLRVSFGDKYCPVIGLYLNITPDTEGRPKLCPLIETEIEDEDLEMQIIKDRLLRQERIREIYDE